MTKGRRIVRGAGEHDVVEELSRGCERLNLGRSLRMRWWEFLPILTALFRSSI
jgi:hypothetical protein